MLEQNVADCTEMRIYSPSMMQRNSLQLLAGSILSAVSLKFMFSSVSRYNVSWICDVNKATGSKNNTMKQFNCLETLYTKAGLHVANYCSHHLHRYRPNHQNYQCRCLLRGVTSLLSGWSNMRSWMFCNLTIFHLPFFGCINLNKCA